MIQQNTDTFFSYSIKNYNAILANSKKSESVTKNFRRKGFLLLSRFKDVLAGTFSEI